MLASLIATAFLAGEQTVEAATARGQHALGRPSPWVRTVAQHYIRHFARRPAPRHRDVVAFLWSLASFRRALRYKNTTIQHWLTEPPVMRPLGELTLPRLATPGDLADWLGFDPADLAWFADLLSLERHKATGARVRHYAYIVQEKPGGRVRLLEAPKTRLKQVQRRILTEILDRVPAHAAAHGFVRGRNIVSFAAPHARQAFVLRLDLADFFPSVSRARIQAVFRTLGYPDAVADLLGGLCTNWAPRDLLRTPDAHRLYGRPHLPQGAPTSPALANLCAYHLDCRLAALAASAGAAYTRYADDLAFSGHRSIERLLPHVQRIVADEGFTVNQRKTRRMPASTSQHLCGLTANAQPNVPRAEFDRLKATLTNCVRHGLASQNREEHADFLAHLAGRVAFCEMVNPAKATRLRRLLDRLYS